MKFRVCMVMLIMLIIVHSVAAQELVVRKDSDTHAITVGSTLTVNISITNLGESSEHVVVQEVVVDAEPVEPEELIHLVAAKGFIGIRPPHYEWELDVGAGSTEILSYTIRPRSVGHHILGATKVYTESGQVLSRPAIVNVLCNANGVCESEFSENYGNCPADCGSGSGDGLCDFTTDGICDPDCVAGADSDCAVYSTVSSQSGWVLFTGIMLLLMLPITGLLLLSMRKKK